MKVKNYMMTNSYDEKIMNWNRQDFTELVNQMAADEISDMNDWLTRIPGNLLHSLNEEPHSASGFFSY